MKEYSRQVIGWFDPKENPKAFIEGTVDEEAKKAVLKDLQEHHYLFSGEEHALGRGRVCPVMEDYRYLRFDEKEFASLMAKAHNEDNDDDYLSQEKISPSHKSYPVRDKTFEEIIQPTREFKFDHERFTLLYRYAGVSKGRNQFKRIYLLPVSSAKGPHYWLGDFITIKLLGSEVGNRYRVERIYSFSSFPECKAALPSLAKGRDIVGYDLDEIEIISDGGPVLLLGIVFETQVLLTSQAELMMLLAAAPFPSKGYCIYKGHVYAFDKFESVAYVLSEGKWKLTDYFPTLNDETNPEVEFVSKRKARYLGKGKLPFEE